MHDIADALLADYEQRKIGRRELLAGLLALGAGEAAAQAPSAGLRGTILNHVTVAVSDFARSRAFYQSLIGATVQKEVANQVDLRIRDSFVTVLRGQQPPGIMHFCVGIEDFEGDATMAAVRRLFPDSQPRLVTNELGQQQIILKDPDGTTVELSAPKYRL